MFTPFLHYFAKIAIFVGKGKVKYELIIESLCKYPDSG